MIRTGGDWSKREGILFSAGELCNTTFGGIGLIGGRRVPETELLGENPPTGASGNPNDWDTVGGSAATNQVNLTIDPAKPAEFCRLFFLSWI